MIDFYTYLHCKPDLTPFYVGKGTLKRCYEFGRGKRGIHHQNIVAKYGQENIQVLIFKKDSEESAFKSEIRLIKMLRNAGFELCNKTDGGEGTHGFHHSNETRAKQAVSAIGRKHSPESIAKMSGKTPSKKTRAKQSAAKIGKPSPNKGKQVSPEMRAKIASATKEALASPEVRAKIRLARSKQIFTEETRAKLSMSAKADWAKRKSMISDNVS